MSALLHAQPLSVPTNKLRRRDGPAPGVVVYKCTVPETFALTFDDGPGEYADELLNTLDRLGAKATFFVNGNNAGSLDDPELADRVLRTYNAGHQIASHTYSHADLTTIGPDQIRSEMTQLDDQLKRIIGVRPTYMRPPYGSFDDQMLGIMSELGYRVISWDIDTNDWQHPDDPSASLSVIQSEVKNASENGNNIALAHETIQTTVSTFTEAAVADIRSKGYRLTTISECLGDPSGAYRD
ncbi:carbohydrate esterase family 4 protein [Thamnocephalis sphaerospora]|uniref:Carbohydrate esterase family 4 protein n=1 Tax=Thamnocephalis sphaerospora TaxID=78915 RepID=A0A4P9XS77_9FUNG|nr:carbohydrate esterase family 4 protein [Thamnocephalis sphaerospora]|eukprot:RKP08984.1 carbohydrate esterase family 4 protein [Thamnocephalis sphaerospora]